MEHSWLNDVVDWAIINGDVHDVQTRVCHHPLVAQRSASSFLQVWVWASRICYFGLHVQTDTQIQLNVWLAGLWQWWTNTSNFALRPTSSWDADLYDLLEANGVHIHQREHFRTLCKYCQGLIGEIINWRSLSSLRTHLQRVSDLTDLFPGHHKQFTG